MVQRMESKNASGLKNGCGGPCKAVAAAARPCDFEEPTGGFALQKKLIRLPGGSMII